MVKTALLSQYVAVEHRRPGGVAVSAISEGDVPAATARIAKRDRSLATEAEDIYDSLTFGEGPEALRLATLQDWPWYRRSTKYMGSHSKRSARKRSSTMRRTPHSKRRPRCT